MHPDCETAVLYKTAEVSYKAKKVQIIDVWHQNWKPHEILFWMNKIHLCGGHFEISLQKSNITFRHLLPDFICFMGFTHKTLLWQCQCSGSTVSPEPWFNIEMSSYQYRKSHRGDKTILRLSYLHNGVSYTGKMTSLYWTRPQAVITQ